VTYPALIKYSVRFDLNNLADFIIRAKGTKPYNYAVNAALHLCILFRLCSLCLLSKHYTVQMTSRGTAVWNFWFLGATGQVPSDIPYTGFNIVNNFAISYATFEAGIFSLSLSLILF